MYNYTFVYSPEMKRQAGGERGILRDLSTSLGVQLSVHDNKYSGENVNVDIHQDGERTTILLETNKRLEHFIPAPAPRSKAKIPNFKRIARMERVRWALLNSELYSEVA